MKAVIGFKQILMASFLTLTPIFAIALGGSDGGGGGGSAILCQGKAPELTDFWEASQKMPSLKPQLDQLRKMNETQAVAFFANQLAQYYENGNTEATDKTIRRFLSLTRAALRSPGVVQDFTFDGTSEGLKVSVQVNASEPDTNDSGLIFGLAESPQCREERVATTKYIWNDAILNTKGRLEIIIRNAYAFEMMSPFDQVGLIMGHEILHGFNKGRLGISELESLNKKDSAEARQLNAWIALSSAKDNLELRSYRPDLAQKVSCSAVSQDSKRKGYLSDRVNFNLFIGRYGALAEIQIYKDENVRYPTMAKLNFIKDAFLLPQGLNLNIGPADSGHSFNFKMNPSVFRFQGLIYKRVPTLDSAAKEESTEKILSIERQPNGNALLLIDNKNTKSNEFRGEIICYSLDKIGNL